MSGGPRSSDLPTSNRRPSSGPGASAPPPGSTGSGSNGSQPQQSLPPSRRASHTLPGISSTASSLRNARKQGSSSSSKSSRLGQAGWGPDDEDDDEDDFEDGPGDTQRQLDELRGGIVMPGMGARGGTAPGKAGQAAQSSGGALPAAGPTNTSAGAPSATTSANTGSVGKNRIPTTLKSALKKPAPLLRRATAGPVPSSAGAAGASAGVVPPSGAAQQASRSSAAASAANRFKGTPPRSIRYSLPVRAEKPVRTTKTSGKHVVLPSESQLAPLPGEEDDDDEDDDDDDEDGSSEDESETDEAADHADDEDQQHMDAAPKDDEALALAREKREASQKAAAERKEQKAAERAAKKAARPEKASKEQRSSERVVPSYHGLRGPAHSRAPPRIPKATGPVFHTFERLAPSARIHTPLPRLTSYTLGNDLHIPTLNGFLRREHGVRPRLYDECAYTVYFKPLLPGFGRANVRSSPEPRSGSPGAESRRERELEEREERGYVGSYFAATKEENDESIDPQGYIQGGEGSGAVEDDSEQRNDHHHHRHSDHSDRERERSDRQRYGGETTEAETETEAEREEERERDGDDLVSSPEGRDGGAILRPRSNRDLTELLSQSNEEEDAENLATPRALRPTVGEGETLPAGIDELEPITSPLSSGRETPVTMEAAAGISAADAAGAQDMLLNQLEDEAAGLGFASSRYDDEDSRVASPLSAVESPGLDAVRSASPTRFADGEGVRPSHGEQESGARDSNTQHDVSETSRQRRRRRPRKTRKISGPNQASHNHDTSVNMLTSRSILEALQVAELVVLPYGVVVFYNFSASEERDIIDDIVSSGCVRGILNPDDVETEAFHFCYDPTVPAPRIFNDFFTFRGPNHLLKISLAHAIAQSTKLSVFEESMQRTLELTSHIPKELASSGELQLKRREALRLTGRLFKLRVDVNLTSNVLDTPELFWSEATLQALYDAIRDYLEIDQRVENLNDRLKVANDLLEIIHGHVAEEAMSKITVVIIALIVVACLVACGEISARLILHARSAGENAAGTLKWQAVGPQQLYLGSS